MLVCVHTSTTAFCHEIYNPIKVFLFLYETSKQQQQQQQTLFNNHIVKNHKKIYFYFSGFCYRLHAICMYKFTSVYLWEIKIGHHIYREPLPLFLFVKSLCMRILCSVTLNKNKMFKIKLKEIFLCNFITKSSRILPPHHQAHSCCRLNYFECIFFLFCLQPLWSGGQKHLLLLFPFHIAPSMSLSLLLSSLLFHPKLVAFADV